MSIIATKPDIDSGVEGSFRYHIKNTLDLRNNQENVKIDKAANASEKSDSATCVVDLEKVKKQYEIWHDSFKGN